MDAASSIQPIVLHNHNQGCLDHSAILDLLFHVDRCSGFGLTLTHLAPALNEIDCKAYYEIRR